MAFSFGELCSLHERFEAQRIEKAQKLVGNRKIKPDPLCKFIVERTKLCPHKLIDPLSNYWMETITVLDGEMGMTLPGKMEEIPALFFDALSIVRSARAQVRKEEKKD